MSVSILAIRYLEDYGTQILSLCDKEEVVVHVEDRKPRGTGSLAAAINSGIKHIKTDYCWIVTNNTFPRGAAYRLFKAISSNEKLVALSPCFDSDHSFTRYNQGIPSVTLDSINDSVPFLEFTSPIVKTKILKEFPLDENMPYWGHDLDWGHRVRQAGFKLGVHHGIRINHIYIRDQINFSPITRVRWNSRKESDESTKQALIAKYGKNWRSKLLYK